jgi:beta-lactamase class D
VGFARPVKEINNFFDNSVIWPNNSLIMMLQSAGMKSKCKRKDYGSKRKDYGKMTSEIL